MHILGIETSCDETAAAVLQDDRLILSSIVSSQISIHQPFGGVVPELASRKHIEAIVPVVQQALQNAGLTADDINAVAATEGPGLVGALLVGHTFAKAYAYARGIPFVGVDHLKGHINTVFLASMPPPFPFISLLVSGGHTAIYHVRSHTEATLLGQTRDDAAGEAFDKVSKMLGLGYPGGRIIGEKARKGDPGRIHFKRPYLDKSAFDFSFSGLKTGVKRYIERHRSDLERRVNDIAAAFQETVVDVLCHKLLAAADATGCRHVAIVGGVAANRRLREKIQAKAADAGLCLHIPSIHLCGDNAAMIAFTGFHYLKRGIRSDLSSDVYSRSMG